ncbi:unnamed protein product [Rotaria magnacalcarata]|uniref:Uncharacterized protein n=3 Tax=Rotaria magnacalcarata TaxID=392030 RepID=A0A816L4B6_9BILA|nr:unnamed protein product [Rotaria magnacalcarata]
MPHLRQFNYHIHSILKGASHIKILQSFLKQQEPFETILFERMSRALPRLRTLEIIDQFEQQENSVSLMKTINIDFPHLAVLILYYIHIDYVKQLICQINLLSLIEFDDYDRDYRSSKRARARRIGETSSDYSQLSDGRGLASGFYQTIVLSELEFLSCYLNNNIGKRGIPPKDYSLLVRKNLNLFASQHKFAKNDNEQITVADYFNDKWKMHLRHQHLLVAELYNPADKNKSHFLSMEKNLKEFGNAKLGGVNRLVSSMRSLTSPSVRSDVLLIVLI